MKKIFLVLLTVYFQSLPSYASDTISLQSLIDTVRQNNPEIKASLKIWQSSENSIAPMSAWNNPWIGLEFMKDDNRLYISQELSFPGKLFAKKNSASSMAKALEQEYRQKVLELDTKVKKAFWSYWLAVKNKDIYDNNIILTKNFLEAAKSKYIAGKVTEADVLAATADLGRMQGMLVMAVYEIDSIKSELNSLMNKSPEEYLGLPEKININSDTVDYAALEQKVLNNNYMLISKKYLYQSALSESKLSKMEWFPNLMAEARISDMSDKTTYMASVQVPLYFWNRVLAVKSKTGIAQSAEQNIETEKNIVRLALKDMCLQYNRNIELIKIYENNILPSAKQAVQISEAGYKAGRIEFQYLLDLQKKYFDAEIEYNKLVAESNKYYAELELLSGGEIK